MKEFFAYFFGAGEKGEFRDFTIAHLAPLLVAAGVIYLIYRYRDQLRDSKHETTVRYVLAFTMIVSEMSYFWRLVGVESLTPNAVDHLPITICGWSIVFCSYLVIGKSQSLFDIAYFWLFAGTSVMKDRFSKSGSPCGLPVCLKEHKWQGDNPEKMVKK